ncbi:hypothetical protein [Nonomuraea sp. PA05]|uniref:hypothetical protein n=1 Tax=Nonomuraea sp. PA05 TaxID=2604466 RepID=UPI001CA31BF4|nr:hypothetical protein [Nonomuraea sp. PA05]
MQPGAAGEVGAEPGRELGGHGGAAQVAVQDDPHVDAAPVRFEQFGGELAARRAGHDEVGDLDGGPGAGRARPGERGGGSGGQDGQGRRPRSERPANSAGKSLARHIGLTGATAFLSIKRLNAQWPYNYF